jgi:hypothetical protein
MPTSGGSMGLRYWTTNLFWLLKAVCVGFVVVAIEIAVISLLITVMLVIAYGVCYVDTAIIDLLAGTQTQSYCTALEII